MMAITHRITEIGRELDLVDKYKMTKIGTYWISQHRPEDVECGEFNIYETFIFNDEEDSDYFYYNDNTKMMNDLKYDERVWLGTDPWSGELNIGINSENEFFIVSHVYDGISLTLFSEKLSDLINIFMRFVRPIESVKDFIDSPENYKEIKDE